MKPSICILFLALTAAPVLAQDFALEQLNNSPRHYEWVDISSGDRTVHSFVAYPETDQATPAVIVIHENRGLTDWVRSFADQLAAAGYLAIAPDLLSDFDAAHSRTSDYGSSDEARDALYQLDADQVTQDLLAVQAYVAALPPVNGKVAVAGFCWGGAQAFRFATNASDLAAALVFYGSPPATEEIPDIMTPVFGFYGENDERINATIPETERLMAQHEKTYRYEIYNGAGHAYMRSGDDPEGSAENKQARDDSWVRIRQILGELE